MNKERMLILADHLEKEVPAELFDMTGYFIALKEGEPHDVPPPFDSSIENCGTAACIAGWTILLFATEEEREEVRRRGLAYVNRGFGDPLSGRDPHGLAASLLGLEDRDAYYLFLGEFSLKFMNKITRADAAHEIRRMVERAPAG